MMPSGTLKPISNFIEGPVEEIELDGFVAVAVDVAGDAVAVVGDETVDVGTDEIVKNAGVRITFWEGPPDDSSSGPLMAVFCFTPASTMEGNAPVIPLKENLAE